MHESSEEQACGPCSQLHSCGEPAGPGMISYLIRAERLRGCIVSERDQREQRDRGLRVRETLRARSSKMREI